MVLAENPLLPDDELRALFAATQRCAKLDQTAGRHAAKSAKSAKSAKTVRPRSKELQVHPSREALLAATTMQLRAGDLLIAKPDDAVAAELAPRPDNGKSAPPPPIPAQQTSRVLLAAAMAAALKLGATDRVVMIFLQPDAAEEGWMSALEWAQTSFLPLILVCGDARGSGAFQASAEPRDQVFTWSAVTRTARKLGLPVLAVDGEDAVAVYRVMQESVLRARSGGGPVILWAMLPSRKEVSSRAAASAPLARLRRYLRSRNISVR